MPTPSEIVSAIDQAILDLVSGKIKEYQIGSTRFLYNDLDKLAALRDKYANLDTQENQELFGVVRFE